MLQWAQRYASLQLDAMHSVRLQTVLEQIAPRFERMPLELPRDESGAGGSGGGTAAARELLAEVLRARLAQSKKELTQEEGMMAQARAPP